MMAREMRNGRSPGVRRRAAGAIVAMGLVAGGAGAQPCEWEHVATPAVGGFEDLLFDVDGSSTENLWAVGQAISPSGSSRFYATLTLRHDGDGWVHVPSPNPSQVRRNNTLRGVLALAADEVYAVGIYQPDFGPSQTMFMEFDGASWQVRPSPSFLGGSSLFAIERVGGDIWAVGNKSPGDPPPAPSLLGLAARWTGSSWQETPVPPLAPVGQNFHYLLGIGGASASDVWAVGTAQSSLPEDRFGPSAYLVHFDGSVWSLVDVGLRDFSGLAGVAALASDDVWAVGWWQGFDGPGVGSTEPLIMHYNGSAWSIIDLPAFPEGPAELRAIAARSPTDIYASGTYATATGTPRPLIMHYDGAFWTVQPMLETAGSHEWFRGMTTLEDGEVWAVGQYFAGRTSGLTARLACGGGGCAADWDASGAVDSGDISAFLTAWLASVQGGTQGADFDGDGGVNSADISAFLTAWLAEVGGNC